MNRLPVILTALVLAACSDSTGVDEIPNIDGSWTYNLTFTTEGSTCTYDPSPVTINQVGATFTGRIDIPDATCTYQGGDPYSLGSWGADIENGTVNAAGAVSFQWGSSDTAYQTGQVNDNSMSGSFRVGSTSGASIGTWTLTR